jgi:hypothetical protein
MLACAISTTSLQPMPTNPGPISAILGPMPKIFKMPHILGRAFPIEDLPSTTTPASVFAKITKHLYLSTQTPPAHQPASSMPAGHVASLSQLPGYHPRNRRPSHQPMNLK